MPVQTQIQVRRGTASSWTSTNPTLAAGEIGFETDTGKIKVGNGSSTWSALNYVGAANAIQYVYNATAGQTSFSGADSNGLTLSYTVGAEQVYVNGVLQVRTSDYTATNGTSVTLTTATIASDVVTIVAFGTFDIANTYTQAQANATFPLNTSSFFAGKNKIINGDFYWNQRAFTSNTTSGAYNYDRFWQSNSGGTVTVTPNTFTPGTAPVAGYEGANFPQIAVTGQSAASHYAHYSQSIEDVRTLANQTITISFWAKASSGTPKIGIEWQQFFGSGGSAAVSTPAGAVTISTSWTRYSLSISSPSISGKTIGTSSGVNLNMWLSSGSDNATRASSIGIQTATFQIWGVQVEAGSVATAFQTATGTIQGELAACQRYYWRANAAAAANVLSTMGTAYNTSGVIMSWQNPVPMRVKASSIDYSALEVIDFVNAGQAITSATADANSTPSNSVSVIGVAGTPLTQYRNYAVRGTSASGYVGFSAEL